MLCFYFVCPVTYSRIEKEEAERQASSREFPLLDMPYRSLLARALKRIPDPAGRTETIRCFFGELQDAWRK